MCNPQRTNKKKKKKKMLLGQDSPRYSPKQYRAFI